MKRFWVSLRRRMRDSLVAKRYADAYIEFAGPRIGRKRCTDDMKDLGALIRETPDLQSFLLAPGIPRNKKAVLLDKVLANILAEETRTFIKFLIVKGRIAALDEIMKYIRIVYSHGDVVNVVLRTSMPLDLDVVGRIKAQVEVFARKQARLYLELDPGLLGGVQIFVGNTVIDGSVRNRLLQLKQQLLQTKVGA